jgi:capsular polysaccharide biosynthesis protein
VIISLIFGVGMAFTLEYFDDTFKSPDDVESSLGIQVLGVLPNISKKSLKL